MTEAQAITVVSDFVGVLLNVLYGVIPTVLGGVAILLAIGIGVRYVFKWIRKGAR